MLSPFLEGIYYLMFTTFARLCHVSAFSAPLLTFIHPGFFNTTYGFGPGIGGLCYLGLGMGFLIATVFGAKFADGVYAKVCPVFFL
jgi:hypothetical protein